MTWTEDTLSERPALALLRKLGYTEIPAERLDQERATLAEVILAPRLHAALRRLNPWLTTEDATKVIKQLTNTATANLTEANELLHTHLTYGITHQSSKRKQSDLVRFFDFDDPSANEFLVCRQYTVRGTKHPIRPDIVCFVNGIPLVVIECKSPTKGEKWREEAIRQLRRYQEVDPEFKGEGAPRLFETVQIVIGTCGQAACYGTVGTPARFFFEWKEPYPHTPAQLEALVEGMPTAQDLLLASTLAPANLLDIVRNFVVFEVEKGRKIKKLCRYKQFIAVNRAIERIVSDDPNLRRGGVVWHTQGSGKSLTMLWLALKLRRDPRLRNPTLVIVTDRRDLDKQISDTFQACGFPNPERAKGIAGLRKLLRNAKGKTITTTIQKFHDIHKEESLFEVDNVIVMVDEAHRSQYRSLAAAMRHALPKATFLGFTGTPIDKQDKSTLVTFGPYIDTYTIRQSVADGATVRILYESRLPQVRIIGQNLDKLFDRTFADRTDEERAAIKHKYTNEQTIAAAPKRIEEICLDIIEHFQQYIAPNSFKAQIVAVSREAAAIYKETLDRLNGPSSALIMSAMHNDIELLARYHMQKSEQDAVIQKFKDREEAPQFLIVCDMLLTGFDAPVEQVMYLDAPLREHNLLQAIARTNRPMEGKTYGLIVDYWGVSAALQEALQIFGAQEIEHALEPKIDELPRLEQRHAAALRFFDAVADKRDLSQCVAALAAEDVRAEFDQAFRRFAQSLDLLYPDTRAIPFVEDARMLGKIRKAMRATYRDGRVELDEDCGKKVRKLIEDAVVAEGIEILVREISLFSPDFGAKLEKLGSDRARASEMEHAIRNEIHVHIDQNPAFYASLRERLEEIVRLRKEQRISDAEQLALFQQMRDTMEHGQADSAAALGLTEGGYAVYRVLDQVRPMAAENAGSHDYAPNRDLAALIDEAIAPFTKLVDWQSNDDVQREMRQRIKRQLRAAGFDEDRVEALARQFVALARARRRS